MELIQKEVAFCLIKTESEIFQHLTPYLSPHALIETATNKIRYVEVFFLTFFSLTISSRLDL